MPPADPLKSPVAGPMVVVWSMAPRLVMSDPPTGMQCGAALLDWAYARELVNFPGEISKADSVMPVIITTKTAEPRMPRCCIMMFPLKCWFTYESPRPRKSGPTGIITGTSRWGHPPAPEKVGTSKRPRFA